jgi:parallel beta-helix repeat protein
VILSFFGSGAQASEFSEGTIDARYTVHSIVRINGDEELDQFAQNEGIPGDGSAANPYVISGYEINVSGEGAGIYIGNITKYVVIESNNIYGSSYSSLPYHAGAGIIVYNNTNLVQVYYNELHDNDYGVYVRQAQTVILSHNNLTGNAKHGAWISFSTDVHVELNNASANQDTGISLYSVDSSVIRYNTCTGNSKYGISVLGDSSYDTIERNTLSFNYDTGVYLSGGLTTTVHDISLRNNTIYNNTYGIRTYTASEIEIENNTLFNHTNYGIYIYTKTVNSTIERNDIKWNLKSGIYI